jgi:hypothetical protein
MSAFTNKYYFRIYPFASVGSIMSRKQRVQYELDCGDVRYLPDNEIRAILRATDPLVATGGRSMLTKILKGSKDKKVLEHGLDR